MQQTTHDDRATAIVERHIESGEELLDTVRAIIQRAYADAEQAQRDDPDAIHEPLAPRADAGDALREMFDEANPLYEDGGVWLTLIDFALDRCDWYAIVDHQRRRMEENRRAEALTREADRAAIEDAVWSPIWRALSFL
jgi:hypothetical protein